MNQEQLLFLLIWLLMLAVLFAGFFISPGSFIVNVVIVGAFISMFKGRITPASRSHRTPLQVLEENRFWRGVAVIYTIGVVGVAIYHLAFLRLAFVDSLELPIVILLILGPALGPIIVCQKEIFEQLVS